MFWYPYTGTMPLELIWPSGFATTSLSLAAVAMAGQLVRLAVRAARTRAVSVPRIATPLDEAEEVKQAAA